MKCFVYYVNDKQIKQEMYKNLQLSFNKYARNKGKNVTLDLIYTQSSEIGFKV